MRLAKRVLQSETKAEAHAVVMVFEAEGLPIGRLLPFYTTPLVSYETNLEKDKEMVGQFHDKARTDAEIVVIAMNRPAPLFFVKLSLSA